jgi:shikimate dehydrogenase
MKILGLIGNPISQSRSPEIFQRFFEAGNIRDFEYRLFQLNQIHQLQQLLRRWPNIVGLNVTIPFKKSVIPLVQKMHSSAQNAGAVNTIRVRRGANGTEMEGYNTDVYGFRKSLQESFTKLPPSALILGTGGSSEAVAAVLNELKISFKKVSRDADKGITYGALTPDIIAGNLLIINTTPLGMADLQNEKADIPYDHISGTHCCFDLVYHQEKTPFLQACETKGAAIRNGSDMLQYQAEASWEIFKGD